MKPRVLAPDRHAARQDMALARAARTADAAEAPVRTAWRLIRRAVQSDAGTLEKLRQVRAAVHDLTHLVRSATLHRLTADAKWSARTARKILAEKLPKRLTEDTRDGEPAPLIHVIAGVPEDALLRIAQAGTWAQRLGQMTKLATGDMLSGVLLSALAAGDTPAEVTRKLLPVVDGVRSTARRIARTESVRVAHDAQMEQWDSLGDLIVGYQINAVLDSRTRPDHRKRDGQKFWKVPRPGQMGLDRMPRPPLEADGSPAWNCRCMLTPIMGDLDAAPERTPDVTPAPGTMHDQRTAIGDHPITQEMRKIAADLFASGELDPYGSGDTEQFLAAARRRLKGKFPQEEIERHLLDMGGPAGGLEVMLGGAAKAQQAKTEGADVDDADWFVRSTMSEAAKGWRHDDEITHDGRRLRIDAWATKDRRDGLRAGNVIARDKDGNLALIPLADLPEYKGKGKPA